jgi:hypothetical protein
LFNGLRTATEHMPECSAMLEFAHKVVKECAHLLPAAITLMIPTPTCRLVVVQLLLLSLPDALSSKLAAWTSIGNIKVLLSSLLVSAVQAQRGAVGS